MKYLSIASRCKALQFQSNTRVISYKTRKSLSNLLVEYYKQTQPSETGSINFMDNQNQGSRHCCRFSLCVVGNGADSSNSLYVNTDFLRYLFNCGEGFQRMATEHGMKLLKTNSVFITHHSWKNIGGLMGFALTQQTLGTREIIVYGPPSIRDIILGSRMFVSLKRLSLNIVVDKPRLRYDDSYLQIQFVPLYKRSSKQIHKCTSDSDMVDQVGHPKSPSKPHSNRSHSEAREPTHEREDYALCYICETPEHGGHLNLKLCLEKGVRPGPMLGMLKSKKDVTLEDGTIVHWKDVLQTSTLSSSVFIVVDCPTEDHLKSLLTEKEFIKYQYDSTNPPKVVVHFTVSQIMNTSQYREWMSRFPPSTVHLRINSDNLSMSQLAAYKMQMKLHLLNPSIFPLLKENNIPDVRQELSGKLIKNNYAIFTCFDEKKEMFLDESFEKNQSPRIEFSSLYTLQSKLPFHNRVGGLQVINAVPTLQIQFTPKKNYDYSHLMCLDKELCMKEVSTIKDIDSELTSLRDFTQSWESSDDCSRLPEYPKILFLGTGSSVPFKTRNTSGILVEVNKNNMMLLDCGEGTYAQMKRFFGEEGLRNTFKKLKLIYVSHPHADHHVGLINILTERQAVLRELRANEPEGNGCEDGEPETNGENDCPVKDNLEDLLLLVPEILRGWLELNSKTSENLLGDCRIFPINDSLQSQGHVRRHITSMGLKSFNVVPVAHCFQSFGATFTDNNNYKITYSGDCLPCEKLIEAGKHCDILIHEATFEDGLERMAKLKKHTTISQAISVGSRMNAQFVMLTHFSQRYSHLPQLTSELPHNVGIAFDNMVVNPKVLPLLPKMMKLLKMLFADKVVVLNNKTLKRILKDDPDDDIVNKMKLIN